MASFKVKLPVLQELFAKNNREPLTPAVRVLTVYSKFTVYIIYQLTVYSQQF